MRGARATQIAAGEKKGLLLGGEQKKKTRARVGGDKKSLRRASSRGGRKPPPWTRREYYVQYPPPTTPGEREDRMVVPLPRNESDLRAARQVSLLEEEAHISQEVIARVTPRRGFSTKGAPY